MKTLIDRRLLREVDRYGLRYACESCCYYKDAGSAEGSRPGYAEPRGCALGYPNREHLAAHLEPGAELVFCKEFELG